MSLELKDQLHKMLNYGPIYFDKIPGVTKQEKIDNLKKFALSEDYTFIMTGDSYKIYPVNQLGPKERIEQIENMKII